MSLVVCPDWRECSYCVHHVEHELKKDCGQGEESCRPEECPRCIVAVKGYRERVDVNAGKHFQIQGRKVFVKEYVRRYESEFETGVLERLVALGDSEREYEMEWLLNTGYMREHYGGSEVKSTGSSGKDFCPSLEGIVEWVYILGWLEV